MISYDDESPGEGLRYRPKLDLDNVPDTSGTVFDDQNSRKKKDEYYDSSVTVPPPFKDEKKDKFVSWSDISRTYKIIAICFGIFVSVGAPTIWFASGLHTDVEVLKKDVTEIKNNTQKLTEISINNSNKIEILKKDLEITNRQVHINENKITEKAEPKHAR